MNKLLLLEDDLILQEIIEEYLEQQGFKVDSFFNGNEALDAILKGGYDLALLDVNVPEVNGFEILEYLREIKNNTPIIFITSLTELKNLKKAFELGANDYLKKPFELEELKIRVEHHIDSLNKISQINGFSFDSKRHILIKDNQEIALKQKESQVLRYLLANRGKVVSQDELIVNVWGSEQNPAYATVRTYIKTLRQALGSDAIKTIKGEGYTIDKL